MQTAKWLKTASPLVFLAGGLLALEAYSQSIILAGAWFTLGFMGALITRVFANVVQIFVEQRHELIQALQNTERSLFQIGSCNKEIRDMVNESICEARKAESLKAEPLKVEALKAESLLS